MLGYLLANRHKSVLFCDLDSQSNLSEMVGKTYNKKMHPMIDLYHGIIKQDLSNSIVHVNSNVDIMPGNWHMNDLVDKLAYVDKKDRYNVLRSLLKPYKKKYDYILLDVPPTLNDIVRNAIFASDGLNLIVQTQASSYTSALKTLEQLIEFRTKDNAHFKLLGTVLYLYEKAKIDKIITKKAKKTFSDSIYPTPIHYQQRVKMFSGYGIREKDHWDRRAIGNYNNILNEILSRCEEMLD